MCVRSWIDAGTRAVVVEMSVYSPPANRFVYVQLMFEIPAEGTNVVPLDTVFTFQVSTRLVFCGCSAITIPDVAVYANQGFPPLWDIENVQSYADLISAIFDLLLIICVAIFFLWKV